MADPPSFDWAIEEPSVEGLLPFAAEEEEYPLMMRAEPLETEGPFRIGGSPPSTDADWAIESTPLRELQPTPQEYRELWSDEVFQSREDAQKYFLNSLEVAREQQYGLETVLGRAGERLPYTGGFKSASDALGVFSAFKDRDNGLFTKRGEDAIADFYAEAERRKVQSTIEYGTEIAMEVPAYWAEFATTMGGFTAVRRGTLAYLKRRTRQHLFRKGLGKLAGRGMMQATAAGAGLATFTAANPWLASEMTAQTNLQLYMEGDKTTHFERALVLGPVRAAMELGTELSGGVVL